MDVIQCTWLNLALPTILNGCEFIPFCETRIIEVEKIQSQVAKFALGLSQSSPNICAQTELGWKPFRQLLYEKQLKFYFRVLYLSKERWVHQALQEHMSGSWTSPYLANIYAIRSQLGIFDAPDILSSWKQLSQEYFLRIINGSLANLPHIQPLESLQRMSYVCENKLSTVISEFRLGCENLGNKKPRLGYNRKLFCPVCPLILPNSGQHLLFKCSSLSDLREKTGIASFLTSCSLRGLSDADSYSIFVSGLDAGENAISKNSFFERAKCMREMRELWLSKW